MEKDELFMDRTFDAACMLKAGDKEWANMIITRLKSNHPNSIERIDQLYEFYQKMSGDYFDARIKYMLEHRNSIKLKFK